MNAFHKGYIERLKEFVIKNFNGEKILPSDCYKLSFEIQAKTSKRVSETTLKRFFGFTSCAHNPSQYTLNAISRYCGFQTWDHFKEHIDKETARNSVNKEWQEVKIHLHRTTDLNITAAKRRIPHWHINKYDNTVINACFDRYERTHSNVMLIHAPAQSGKTEAIARWVEDAAGNTTNNMILYMDSLPLFESAVYGYNADRWLANVMDFRTGQLVRDFFQHYRTTAPGMVHIIVDGFSEETLSERQYYAVLTNLLELINQYNEYSWLKFTFILRTNIYEKMKRKIPKFLQSNWYVDRVFQHDEVFKYSTKQISLLLNACQVEHSLGKIASSGNFEWLKHPKFFHWFIDHKDKNPLSDFRDPELIFIYIHDFFTKNSVFYQLIAQTPPILLLELFRSIPHGSKVKDPSAFLSKSKLTLIQTLELYNEMVGHGILLTDTQAAYGRFSFPHYKSYIIAYYLYHIRDLKDRDLFYAEINQYIDNDENLLKLTAIFYVLFQAEDLSFAESLPELSLHQSQLSHDDTLYFLVVFANWLYADNDPVFKEKVRTGVINSGLINKVIYTTHFQYPVLKKVILYISALELDEAREFQLHFKLATFAFMFWDEDEFIRQLELMSALSQGSEHVWSVNAVDGLSALYTFIRYKKINNAEIRQIINTDYVTEIKDNIQVQEELFSFEFVGYLIIILSRDRELAAQYLKTIDYKISKISDQKSLIYTLYYLLRQLIGTMAHRTSPLLPDPVHSAYTEKFKTLTRPHILHIFAYILTLHVDLASAKDREATYKKSQEIEDLLKPLGYRILTKYFSLIFFANKAR